MTRVCVEAAFGSTLADAVSTGGVWTDISGRADLESGIGITRGAENELSQTQAGTCTLTLNNEDGALTPTNPASPYYPNVIDAVPIRINVATVTTNYLRNPSFEGGSLETWEWSEANASPVGTPVQSGTQAARVTWNTGALSAYFQTTIYGLTIGAKHTASVYVRVPAGDATVRLRMGGVTSAASAVFDSYTRLTATFTATASVMTLQVIPSTSPAAGDLVYVDSVQVEAGASATTFSATPAQLHPRFWGLVNQWPVQWSGLYSSVTVTATDIFAVLSRADQQMRPMLVQEVMVWTPHAYWPMDEPADSTSAGDESGMVGPLSLDTTQAGAGGTLAFAGGLAPLGMDGAPLFTPGSASAGKYLRASVGQDFQDATNTEAILVEAWFSTSTVGRAILALADAGVASYLVLSLAAGTGFLTVTTAQPGVTPVVTTVGAVSLADGVLHHVIYSSATQELYVDGVSIGSFGGIQLVSDLTTLTVGANQAGGSLWSGSISNVALYADSAMVPGDLAGHYTCGTTGFAGETADERALRLVTYLGLGFQDVGVFTTGIAQQAALGSTCLDHLREVELTEDGVLSATRDGPFVRLRGRSTRYNPTADFSLQYADFEPGDFTLAYDTQKVVNVAHVSRPGGATQRVVHAASRAARGPIGRTVDTLATTDLVTADRGNWLLQRYAVPQPELRGVTMQAYSMGTAMYRTLMAADIGTAFTVTAMPAQAPGPTMTATVEGYTETIKHNDHEIAFHTSKTVTDAVWVLDDPVYSVLGSTTRLAF
ncbi:LamG-like jellyroll fold domain-containing protein [Streptomyces sp. NPDC056707]|uniref:LamG-like jellyroll fold domain-containing protein n=1 Tax=Streptomyces sp. NPDC056707 TaxID=3345919 RepID=UPI00367F6492